MLNVKAIGISRVYSLNNTLVSQPNQNNSPVYLNQPAKDEVSFKGFKDKLAEAFVRGAKPLTELLGAARAKGEDEIINELSAFLAKRKAKADKMYFLDELKDGRLVQRELINSKGKTIRLSEYSKEGNLKYLTEYSSRGEKLFIYNNDGTITIIEVDKNAEPIAVIKLNADGKELFRMFVRENVVTTALPGPNPHNYNGRKR